MKPVMYRIPIWRYRKDAGFEEERKFSKFRPAKVDGFGIEMKRKVSKKP
jgi:hypothetical protein